MFASPLGDVLRREERNARRRFFLAGTCPATSDVENSRDIVSDDLRGMRRSTDSDCFVLRHRRDFQVRVIIIIILVTNQIGKINYPSMKMSVLRRIVIIL